MNNLHWTEKSAEDFRFNVAFDYVAQVEQVMEEQELRQIDLAGRMGVTKGRISQFFNNPGNLSLKSMVEWARALGHKVAVVLYDDGDRANKRGPVDSEVFRMCWEKLGKPVDVEDVLEMDRKGTTGFRRSGYVDNDNVILAKFGERESESRGLAA